MAMLDFLGRRRVIMWHHPAYRLPIGSVEGALGIEPRRADLVSWFLLEERLLRATDLRTPRPARWEELALVHAHEYLESLTRPETLARIFAVDPSEIPVDEALASVRLATGGTIAATREALRRRGPTLNLLGGFHHAGPARGGGLCAVNDIAVALAVARRDGFGGRAVVIDLDAHPPDGTAECLRGDARAWLGSLSGADWGVGGEASPEGEAPPGAAVPRQVALSIDEVQLPGADDRRYLVALDGLLERMGRAELAFVIAGGDVLAGDKLGHIALTLDGARRRDLRVAAALRSVPSVWLPGGGYSGNAWKVLAGTALALLRGSRRAVPDRDPLARHFSLVAARLHQDQLADFELTEEDVVAQLESRPPPRPRLCGFYSPDGVEYGLYRYGVLSFLERLGYHDFRIEIDPAVSAGDRLRLFGRDGEREHLLVDCALQAQTLPEGRFLYVHWLSLRNPRAQAARPLLPGQEAPGLGMSREVGELFVRMATRLGLDGVAFRPAWYHVAFAARHRMRFADPARQGRFEALLRDLRDVPLDQATRAVAERQVLLDGAPYAWEADLMVERVAQKDADAAAIAAARDAAHFQLAPAQR
jgi:acetoin utilization deacetylase AcuC-like enzyme